MLGVIPTFDDLSLLHNRRPGQDRSNSLLPACLDPRSFTSSPTLAANIFPRDHDTRLSLVTFIPAVVAVVVSLIKEKKTLRLHRKKTTGIDDTATSAPHSFRHSTTSTTGTQKPRAPVKADDRQSQRYSALLALGRVSLHVLPTWVSDVIAAIESRCLFFFARPYRSARRRVHAPEDQVAPPLSAISSSRDFSDDTAQLRRA